MKYQSPLPEKDYKGNNDYDVGNDNDDEGNDDEDDEGNDDEDDEGNDEGLWLFDRPFHLWCIN